jgi:hypothetical protein
MRREEKQRIQGLINDLELCHHKAQRHVEIIIQAIAEGHTTKRYRARESESTHPATQMWRNAIDVLSAWLSGDASGVRDLDVGEHSGKRLLDLLGERTELKEWQIQQVISKLKAASRMYPECAYHEMVEYPEEYEDCRDLRNRTVETRIHDTKDGEKAEISLGAAIDHLQPCNWNFPDNFMLVLRAINGGLSPTQSFAAHARNIRLNPIGDKMRTIANTLRAYCQRRGAGDVDQSVLEALGERTPERTELAEMLLQKISGAFE